MIKKPKGKIQRKILAFLPLLLPVVFLLIFTFGELFSGSVGGLSHLIQLLPILFLGYLAHKKARLGGIIFIIVGILLGFLYAGSVPFEPTTIILVEISLFIPLVVSGILLFLYKE